MGTELSDRNRLSSRHPGESRPTCAACEHRRAALGSDTAFCCAACALSAGVPRDADGNFPITRPLVIALVLFFIAFNQALLAGLMRVVVDNPAVRQGLSLGSLACGVLYWILLVTIHFRIGATRIIDLGVLVGGAILLGLALVTGSTGCALAATVVATGWTLRGWLRIKSS